MSELLYTLSGIAIGWWWAHYTVLSEIKKLGRFYVGKEVVEGRVLTKDK